MIYRGNVRGMLFLYHFHLKNAVSQKKNQGWGLGECYRYSQLWQMPLLGSAPLRSHLGCFRINDLILQNSKSMRTLKGIGGLTLNFFNVRGTHVSHYLVHSKLISFEQLGLAYSYITEKVFQRWDNMLMESIVCLHMQIFVIFSSK